MSHTIDDIMTNHTTFCIKRTKEGEPRKAVSPCDFERRRVILGLYDKGVPIKTIAECTGRLEYERHLKYVSTVLQEEGRVEGTKQ